MQTGLRKGQSPFVVIGESQRGKTNVLKCILNQMNAADTVYVYDSQSMELNGYKEKGDMNYLRTEDDIGGNAGNR